MMPLLVSASRGKRIKCLDEEDAKRRADEANALIRGGWNVRQIANGFLSEHKSMKAAYFFRTREEAEGRAREMNLQNSTKNSTKDRMVAAYLDKYLSRVEDVRSQAKPADWHAEAPHWILEGTTARSRDRKTVYLTHHADPTVALGFLNDEHVSGRHFCDWRIFTTTESNYLMHLDSGRVWPARLRSCEVAENLQKFLRSL